MVDLQSFIQNISEGVGVVDYSKQAPQVQETDYSKEKTKCSHLINCLNGCSRS